MTNLDKKIFDNLSEKYSTWIVKYCSTTLNKPIFMIWYRNEDNETEHILCYKSGKIFATKTLIELKKELQSKKNDLNNPQNINQWIEKVKKNKMFESYTYDLISVIYNLKKNILDIKTIESFAEFINLFDDFINQDEKNNHLKVYIDDELIKKTWEYYYEYIFWPRFNNKEKFELWNRPKLEIDTEKLLSKFQNIILKFENNLKKSNLLTINNL